MFVSIREHGENVRLVFKDEDDRESEFSYNKKSLRRAGPPVEKIAEMLKVQPTPLLTGVRKGVKEFTYKDLENKKIVILINDDNEITGYLDYDFYKKQKDK